MASHEVSVPDGTLVNCKHFDKGGYCFGCFKGLNEKLAAQSRIIDWAEKAMARMIEASGDTNEVFRRMHELREALIEIRNFKEKIG